MTFMYKLNIFNFVILCGAERQLKNCFLILFHLFCQYSIKPLNNDGSQTYLIMMACKLIKYNRRYEWLRYLCDCIKFVNRFPYHLLLLISGYSGFLHQKHRLLQYNWNIGESGIEHHINPLLLTTFCFMAHQ